MALTTRLLHQLRQGPMTATELAAVLQADAQTVSATACNLVKQGCIQRTGKKPTWPGRPQNIYVFVRMQRANHRPRA